MYLILKSQVLESVYSVWAASRSRSGRSPHRGDVYAKALAAFANWTRAVRDEEMQQLLAKQPDIEELWKDVAMIYVRLCHKYTDAKTVRIKAPVVEEVVQNFFQHIVKSAWCQTGDLWAYDHVKLDFTLREFFRRAVMDSVHIVRVTQEKEQQRKSRGREAREPPREKHEYKQHEEAKEAAEDDVYPDDSVSAFFNQRESIERTARESIAARDSIAARESVCEERATKEPSEPQRKSPKRKVALDDDAATVVRGASQRALYASRADDMDGATVAGNQYDEYDAATVAGAFQRDAGDGATVVGDSQVRFRDADAATVARGDAQSTVSSTSSGSRFSKLTAPKPVSLHSLPAIDEVKTVHVSELPDVMEDDDSDEPFY